MFFNRASLVTLAVSAIGAKAVYFVPVSSDVTQCDTIQLNFKGEAPFTIAVWPGCDDDADADQAYASYHTNATVAEWKVNIGSGKSVMFEVEDAQGNVDYTEDYPIKASNDASCLGVKPSFSSPYNSTSTTTSSASLVKPTTQSQSVSVAPNNVGGNLLPTTTYSDTSSASATGAPIGGIGGAVTNFSPRMEMAALVVLGSTVASLLF